MNTNTSVKNTQIKPQTKLSIVDKDTIVENIFNPETQTSKYAIYKNGDITYEENYLTTSGREYLPLNSTDSLFEHKLLHLASEASEYFADRLLDENIYEFIRKYFVVEPDFEVICKNYIKLTWLYDNLSELPYLRFSGQEGVGKSRALKTIGILCYKSIIAGNATESSIFRMIDQVHGTMVLDEADLAFSDNTSGIIKLLNNGFQKGMPSLRTKPKNDGVEAFSTFSPKIVGMHNSFSDSSLESRFITKDLYEEKLERKIPKNLDENFFSEALEIRNSLLMYRFKNYFRPLNLSKSEGMGFKNRIQQIYNPLLAITDNKSEEEVIFAQMRIANTDMINEKANFIEAKILRIMKKYFDNTSRSFIYFTDIISELKNTPGLKFIPTETSLGKILRKRLRLQTNRGTDGYTGVSAITNEESLLRAYKEFWIINEPNDVNEDVRITTTINTLNDLEKSKLENVQKFGFDINSNGQELIDGMRKVAEQYDTVK
jgi:hypothetical protein